MRATGDGGGGWREKEEDKFTVPFSAEQYGLRATGVAKPAFKHMAAINTVCCVGTMQSSFIYPVAVLYGKVQIKSITLS